MSLRGVSLLSAVIAVLLATAQPDMLPGAFNQGCDLPQPDSLDITGDGVHDLVVHGMYGMSTCDIPVSVGTCQVMVSTLPGTQLLALLHPMVGHDVRGFTPGDTLPVLNSIHRHDPATPLNMVDRYVFMRGSVRALNWSYGVRGSSPPQLAPGAERVFVFATTAGEITRYGTFTLEMIPEKRTVRIREGASQNGNKPEIVR